MLQRAAMAVLDAIGQVPGLWDQYVVKGGLALRYAYGSPRRTHDLDFNTVADYAASLGAAGTEPLHAFCDRLEEGLALVAPRYGFSRLVLQFREFLSDYPVIYLRLGYTHVPDREPPYDDFLEMQATLSTQIRATQMAEAEGLPIRVPLIEDIVADKLKAILQQPLRDVYRPADLFDLYYVATALGDAFDREKVTRFLVEKSASWDDVPAVTRAAFRDPAVAAHATARFDEVADQLPPTFQMPSADEAFEAVLGLVEALDLPEKARKAS